MAQGDAPTCCLFMARDRQVRDNWKTSWRDSNSASQLSSLSALFVIHLTCRTDGEGTFDRIALHIIPLVLIEAVSPHNPARPNRSLLST